jgi:hypothetical protein
MSNKPILLFFISLLCSGFVQAQSAMVSTDSLSNKVKYGFRVGADLSKPLRTLLDSDYSGFEILADFRVSKKFYVAGEIGSEKKDRFETNLNSRTAGSYIKIGADYNSYENWFGMSNAIFTGLRYGFSTFSQELLGYSIYTTNQQLPPSNRVDPIEFSGLTAHWVELILGIKTELINNLYLSLNVQLKRKIYFESPENFDNLYVPGFNRTYDESSFGVGYGYTLSYLIPIYRK